MFLTVSPVGSYFIVVIMMKIDIDGLKLNYLEEGSLEKKTVLIVHGWGANIKTVMPIVNILKHDFHVVALDMPAHGESDVPTEVFGTADFADVISKFMERLSITNCYYIGHSFGGKCGIYLAGHNHPSIERLVLVDASGIKPELTSKTKFKVKIFKLMKAIYIKLFGKENIDKFYKRFGSSDYKAADGIVRNILVKVVNEDLTQLLSNIGVPTLLVWGERDGDTPLYMAEIMNEEIRDSKLVVLDGGHYSYLDDSINFKKAVLDFLS